MSLETTEAQAAARAAEQDWAAHRRGCPPCSSQARNAAADCAQGAGLKAAAAESRKQARESARADKMPGPGDIPLFDPPGAASPQVTGPPKRARKTHIDDGHQGINGAPGTWDGTRHAS